MEGGDGGGGVGRRRISLLDHMSVVDNSTEAPAGLTLDAVLGGVEKRPSAAAMAPTSAQMNRTLLDVIRDEEPHGSLFGHKDKKSWKAFRDRLRLKRAGAAWTSSIHVPASDLPMQSHNNVSAGSGFGNNSRSFMSRRNSVRFTTVSSLSQDGSTLPDESGDNVTVSSSSRPQMTRRSSTRFGPTALLSSDSIETDNADANIHAVGEGPPARSFRPQMTRHSSTRFQMPNPDSEDNDEEPARETRRHLATVLAEERQLSAREAVAAQEAAEAEAAARAAAEGSEGSDEGDSPANEEATEAQAVRISLMDLLEETDRQMGLEGSRYTMGDGLERYEEEEEEEEERAEEGRGGGGGVEHTCCVCMVRHKGAAFIPCGHTFCRLCSRELWVQRGNCPLCNGFILEILDIF